MRTVTLQVLFSYHQHYQQRFQLLQCYLALCQRVKALRLYCLVHYLQKCQELLQLIHPYLLDCLLYCRQMLFNPPPLLRCLVDCLQLTHLLLHCLAGCQLQIRQLLYCHPQFRADCPLQMLRLLQSLVDCLVLIRLL